jgi:hypothetical protein
MERLERIGRGAANASWKVIPMLVIGAALMVGGCGGDTGSDTSVAPSVDPSARELGLPPADSALVRPVRRYGAEVPVAYYDLSFKLSKRTGGITPPVQARIFAYMGLALYESLVAGMPRHRSIARHLNGIGELPKAHGDYYWPLVASAAMAEVMRGLWGDATSVAAQNIADIDALEAQFAAAATDVHRSLGRRSIDFGHAVGAAIFETSKDDGEHRAYLTNFPTSYVPPVGAGLWVPLPGQTALQPFWRDMMTPFVSPGAACDPGPPPAYSEVLGSNFYNQAFEVYDVSTHLTVEQLSIAQFWADGPGTIGGPGHSLSTTSQVLVQVGANLAQAAETFARVGHSHADALLTCWFSKYQYNLIRPITYIRNVLDPAYSTPLPTPPFPEYTSAHSAQTAAALSTLQILFGDIGYTDHTHDVDGFAPRTFASLSDSMLETGISRLYGGIHYRAAIFDGFAQGRCVSAKVNALPWRKLKRESEVDVQARSDDTENGRLDQHP